MTGYWEGRERLEDEGVQMPRVTDTQGKKWMEINVAEGKRWKERGLSWD